MWRRGRYPVGRSDSPLSHEVSDSRVAGLPSWGFEIWRCHDGQFVYPQAWARANTPPLLGDQAWRIFPSLAGFALPFGCAAYPLIPHPWGCDVCLCDWQGRDDGGLTGGAEPTRGGGTPTERQEGCALACPDRAMLPVWGVLGWNGTTGDAGVSTPLPWVPSLCTLCH